MSKISLPQPLIMAAVGLPLMLVLLDLPWGGVGLLLQWGFLGLAGWGLVQWRLGKGRSPRLYFATPPKPNREVVHQTLALTSTLLHQLQTESPQTKASDLQQRAVTINSGLQRQQIQIAVIGCKGVGKTSLLQLLQAPNGLALTSACSIFEAQLSNPPLPQILQADLILFLVSGDLTQLEFDLLVRLHQGNHRTLIVWNKQDQYLPAERRLIEQRLSQHLQDRVAPADMLAIATHPQPLRVRQLLADGTSQEHLEYPPPQITPLLQRLEQILTQEAADLVVRQTLHQAQSLQLEAQALLNQARYDRALPILERWQWIAAGIAFANPVPALDVLATTAISAQMVRELAEVYQYKLSLSQATAIARILGSLVLKLGLVEFSTQALTTLLKGNGLTFIAGGLIQGGTAAYLTRLAGLSLIEHFQNSNPHPQRGEPLRQILPRVFQSNQHPELLQGLLHKASSQFQSAESHPNFADPAMLTVPSPITDLLPLEQP